MEQVAFKVKNINLMQVRKKSKNLDLLITVLERRQVNWKEIVQATLVLKQE